MRGPMQEGSFPVPGQIRLLRDRSCRGRAGGPRGKTVFCLHPHQDYFNAPVDGPGGGAGGRPGAGGPPWPPTWKRPSTPCGTPAPGPATASSWWGPASWGCWWHPWPPGCPAPRSRPSTWTQSRKPILEALGAGLASARPRPRRGRHRLPRQRQRRRPEHRHRLRRPGRHHRRDELVRGQAGQRRSRRRLPQPPAEARLLPGRPGLDRPPPALGLSAAAARWRCRLLASRRSMRWSPRRSPSRMRRASCRAFLHRVRKVLPRLSAIPQD